MTNFDYIKKMDIEAFASLIMQIKVYAVEETFKKLGLHYKTDEDTRLKVTIEIYEHLKEERVSKKGRLL